jgi:hypothetical protein
VKGSLGKNQKFVNGEIHRRCSGPAHEEPVWLPETHKYFYYRPGLDKFRSRCRLCHAWVPGMNPGEHGFVPAKLALPFFIEGVNRVGQLEFARRIGIAQENLGKIIRGERRFLRKLTVKRAMLEVISIRRKGEVRHRKSIRRGTLIRGEPEKKVKSKTDLYRPHGDADLELRRRSRVA